MAYRKVIVSKMEARKLDQRGSGEISDERITTGSHASGHTAYRQ